MFCKEKIKYVDYKDTSLLRRFISDRGKIRARRVSGNCAQHQREVAVAIKTARELALLPYAQRTMTERTGPRGPRQDRSDMPPMPSPDSDDAVGVDEMDDAVLGGSLDSGGVDDVDAVGDVGDVGDVGVGDVADEVPDTADLETEPSA